MQKVVGPFICFEVVLSAAIVISEDGLPSTTSTDWDKPTSLDNDHDCSGEDIGQETSLKNEILMSTPALKSTKDEKTETTNDWKRGVERLEQKLAEISVDRIATNIKELRQTKNFIRWDIYGLAVREDWKGQK